MTAAHLSVEEFRALSAGKPADSARAKETVKKILANLVADGRFYGEEMRINVRDNPDDFLSKPKPVLFVKVIPRGHGRPAYIEITPDGVARETDNAAVNDAARGKRG